MITYVNYLRNSLKTYLFFCENVLFWWMTCVNFRPKLKHKQISGKIIWQLLFCIKRAFKWYIIHIYFFSFKIFQNFSSKSNGLRGGEGYRKADTMNSSTLGLGTPTSQKRPSTLGVLAHTFMLKWSWKMW